jgi:hypothetical protein
MAYQNQQFFGAIDADNILKENFIIATGNFASGSNEIADFNVISGDENLLRISQSIYSVGGHVTTDAYITNINGSLITINKQATSTGAGDTIGISTPSGSYLVSSASFNDPNNAISVNDITGSIAGQDYAILAAAQRDGTTAKGVFHIYKIQEVVHRDIATANFSFFVEWGEQGTEADSGDVLRVSEKALAIVNLSDTGSLAPEFSLGIAGMESLPAGSEYVGYNVALNQYFTALSGSQISIPGRNTELLISDGAGQVTTETNLTFDGELLNVLGNVYVQGTLDAATKNFKIQHPTMPGYYLVHSSLEGPERGMYVRGKLKTSNTIHLPDYWNELTDDIDITVQLTPIGNSCTHFVKSVNKQEIVIGCDCGTPHCFYIVHAQRYNEGKFDVLQPKKIKSL